MRAELLAARLDRPMAYLGVLLLFVVLGQLLVTDPGWTRVLAVTGWALWALFVAEFRLRAYVGGFSAALWRRNWGQLIFLAIPFLRFVRGLQAIRVLRVARRRDPLGRDPGLSIRRATALAASAGSPR